MASQPPAPARTGRMHAGRQADSGRRRQRVITATDQAATSGSEISVSGIARTAGVDRTFLYRHRDLLEKIHVLEASPPAAGETPGPAVTRASLQADLLTADERAARLNARIRQLEKRLSQALGEQAWRQSGHSPPSSLSAAIRTEVIIPRSPTMTTSQATQAPEAAKLRTRQAASEISRLTCWYAPAKGAAGGSWGD